MANKKTLEINHAALQNLLDLGIDPAWWLTFLTNFGPPVIALITQIIQYIEINKPKGKP